jgi:hypothetical protein
LLYRCYIVWNRDKRVVILPTIVLIVTPVCGYTFAGSSSTMFFPQSWIYTALTLLLNVTLTALTGELDLDGIQNFACSKFSGSNMVGLAEDQERRCTFRASSSIQRCHDDIVSSVISLFLPT